MAGSDPSPGSSEGLGKPWPVADQAGSGDGADRGNEPRPSAAGAGRGDDQRDHRPVIPSISLPKGGGAIKGIDEKLTAGQPTGTAALTVPLPVSTARQGFSPGLALSYDSAAGNGPFGLGWNLPVPAVTRKTSRGLPTYQDASDADVFVLSAAEDLVPLLDPPDIAGAPWVGEVTTGTWGGATYSVRRYRPRVEGGFARIERWTAQAGGDVHWRTVTAANVTSLYGQDATSRIADPADPTRILSWLLDLSYDDRGNAVSYVYKAEDAVNVTPAAHEARRVVTANRYLKRIFYGNDTPYLPATDPTLPSQWCFQLVLDYGEHDPTDPTPAESGTWTSRPDPFSTYRAGFEIRTHRTCRRFLMFHQFPEELGEAALVVRSLDLGYSPTPDGTPLQPTMAPYSFVTSVTSTGWLWDGTAYETAGLPPLELGYGPLTTGPCVAVSDPVTLENLLGDAGGPQRRWVDLDSEGLPGLLAEDAEAWYYKRNLSAWSPDGSGPSARLAPLETVATRPGGARPGQTLLNPLNGDGHLAAVTLAPPAPGYYERGELTAGDEWSPFRPFRQGADIDWTSPDLRMVDLDGDGLADILLTGDDALSWYRYVPFYGFEGPATVPKPFDEDAGPALVLADGTSSIYLADMSGDGLSDLVRIRNGEVCYWPNLGFCRFGPMIVMDGAPWFDEPDRFDQRRLRLCDIDGTGTADLVYLGATSTTAYLNCSGNAWSAPRPLPGLPAVDDVARVDVLDLLGTGTACLVWASPLPGDAAAPLRYLDLTDGAKPYLLQSVSNNRGAVTTLGYTPSTSFYLQDGASGDRWATRIPFPVHVVSRVQNDELVTRTSVVSTYTYHHGYYDGVEREFRGFARVDQYDTDLLPSASGSGLFTSTPTVDGDEFALPPVRTRTWYHTGAWFGSGDIAARLALEYYQGDPDAAVVGPTVLGGAVSDEEAREACRALRGRPLRQEVYAADGTPSAGDPYSVVQHRYQVVQLQPPWRPAQPDDPFTGPLLTYGSYYAYELESLSSVYERDPTDPRLSHALTLEVDPYGNVTKSAAVAYPRRVPAYPEQAATLVTYAECDVTNVTDQAGWYRLGLSVESRHYELTGVAPSTGPLFDPAGLLAEAAGATTLSYEAVPSGTSPEKRLFARNRTLYLADDLSGSVPLGQADSLGLVAQQYQLVETPGLVTGVFGSVTTLAGATTVLTGSGKLVDLDSDGNLWAPTTTAVYSPDPTSPEATFARAHFFLAQGSRDPFGNVATVSYDSHQLLVTGATDALGNTTTAANNYRMLSPWLSTDANLNRTGVRWDALGVVVASAVMGKALGGGGDEGDHLDTTTPEAAPSDDPTVRYDYDLAAYQAWADDPAHDPDHPAPNWVHTAARVRHQDPTTPWIERYAYTDGLDRVVLTKAQAEPGPAPQRYGSGTLLRTAQGGLVIQQTTARWVGSGRVVYDNKAHPVKAYEPFFDSSPVYDDETDLVQWGVTAITRYDPPGRVIRVDNPNGTYSTVALAPWQVVEADENDNVLGSAWYAGRSAGQLGPAEADAATKTAAHADTPTVTDLDPLGRAFRSDRDNGAGGHCVVTVAIDIQGNVRATVDELGRTVLTQDYDLPGAEIHHSSVDVGDRWLLAACDGQALSLWDSRGYHSTQSYDALRRPVTIEVTGPAQPTRQAELLTYGEGLATAQDLNLRGQLYQHHDEAGIATTAARDFQGNTTAAGRQFLEDPAALVDWSSSPTLSAETFTSTSTYDALNRVVTTTTPDGSVTTPTYNVRNLVNATSVQRSGEPTPTAYLVATSYDAKGQRTAASYGNGLTLGFQYDPETFRLVGVEAVRTASPSTLQDLTYTYDPVGNVTHVADAAQQTVFFSNQAVSPDGDFTYDPTYRLVLAHGREQVGQASAPQTTWDDGPRVSVPLPTDGQAMQAWTEAYAFDLAGNLTSLTHTAAVGSWTRTYAYDEPHLPPQSNRLTSTTVGAATETYTYDAAGNMTAMPQLSQMVWDWKSRLVATASQLVHTGTPETTDYRYDAGGGRLRKATTSSAGALTNQRLYLGPYEVYREYSGGTVTLERQCLHVLSGAALVCLVETTTIDASQAAGALPQVAPRYQLANAIGSAVLELDQSAAVLTYEEFYPYGSTSFATGSSAAEVSLKRYRFSGKERDVETGLYYVGARYHAPWLGRWISPDPAGIAQGTNLYRFCSDNPVSRADHDGKQTGSTTSSVGVTIDWRGVTIGSFPVMPLRSDQVVAFGRADADYMGRARTVTGLIPINIEDRYNVLRPEVQGGSGAGFGNARFPSSWSLRSFYTSSSGTVVYPMFSGHMAQEALEGNTAGTVHFDARGVDLTPPLQTGLPDPAEGTTNGPGFNPGDYHSSSELRQGVAHVAATDAGERNVDIVITHENGVSTITRDSNSVQGDPLPPRLADRMPNVRNTPSGGSSGSGPAGGGTGTASSGGSGTTSGGGGGSGSPGGGGSGSPGGGGSGAAFGSALRTGTASVAGGIGLMVPGVAEFQSLLMGLAYSAYGTPYAGLVSPLMSAAEAVPVAAGAGVIGAGAGHLARAGALAAGASEAEANTIGFAAAITTGALIGSVIPGVGTATGAVIGGILAGALYLWSL